MDLINWSLNAINQILSTRKQGKGEPACPEGTFIARYMLDAWNLWRSLRLTLLPQEDMEDVYIFGFMIVGFLLIGTGGFLIYRKLRKVQAALLANEQLLSGGLNRASNQTIALTELNPRTDVINGLLRKVDDNLEKLVARRNGP